MKKITLLIMIIILISSSLSGCISDDDEKNELNIYLVNYIEKCYQINETNYTLAENSTIIIENLSVQNITKIYFNLKWEDTHEWPPRDNTRVFVPYRPEPDTFSLSVRDPNGTNVTYIPSQYAEETSFNGNINITGIINNVTGNQTVYERSINDVVKRVSSNNGIGSWEINITCVEAPGTGPGGFMGPGHDMGNDWELTINIYYFEGNITKINDIS